MSSDDKLDSVSYRRSGEPIPPPARRDFQIERVRTRQRSRNSGLVIYATAGFIGVAVVGLMIAAAVISLVRNPPLQAAGPPTARPTQTPIQVTATPPDSGEPTSVLPIYYVLELSATPPATATAIPTFVDATPTSAFQPVPTQFLLSNSLMVYVCFIEGHDDLCTMNADGTNQQRLTTTRGTDWYPALAADGGRVVYSTQRGGNFDIWIMNIDGSDARQITEDLGMNFAPDLSPDGSQVVFASTAGTDGRTQNIWVINTNGSNPRQLTDSAFDDIDPIWSPDGSQIVFSSNRGGTTELFVMNPDGSNIRQLTRGVNLGGRSDWSADGQWLTFYAGDPGNKNIYLLDATCAWSQIGCITEPLLLVAEGNSKGPSFSPDSQWVVFTGSNFQGDPDNEIYVVSIDGSTIYKLTNNSTSDWQPRWAP